MSKCNCGCSSTPKPQTSKIRHKGEIENMSNGLIYVDVNVKQSECKCCALSTACKKNSRNIVTVKGDSHLNLSVGDAVEVEIKATPVHAFIVRYNTLLRYVLIILLSALTYLFSHNEELTCVVLVIAMVLNFIISPRIHLNNNKSTWKIVRKL